MTEFPTTGGQAEPAERGVVGGMAAKGATVTIQFGDRPIRTLASQSVIAALVAAGAKTCRETAAGNPRGIFCGMGVCQDCVVSVDGSVRRACMTIVRDGMRIEPLEARPEPSSATQIHTTVEKSPDVLVIGGGPAGLAAAAVAAEAGLGVLLLDERAKLGGQFYKQPAEGFAFAEDGGDRQFRSGRALIRRAVAAGVEYIGGMTVWAAFDRDQFVASSETLTIVVRPRRVVLATGAYERGVPIPGWTLPGYMTTGAAQTLLRSYQSAPGRRVLIGGNGPLNMQVATELIRAGVEVVALVELAGRPGPGAAASLATMAVAAPDLVRDGISYQLELRRAGVPVLYRHSVVRVTGVGRVEQAVIAQIDDSGKPIGGTERRFEVDTVCVGAGFIPSNEIARALGCAHRFDRDRGYLVAERDATGRSSVPKIWIAGDSAGLGGARMAEAGGMIAGADVVADHGGRVRDAGETDRAKADVARARRFQSALWTLFRAPRIVDQFAAPDTHVCRCEEISLATIEQAIDQGCATAGAVKRRTRAGMGRCQGRYCGPVIADLVARRRGTEIDEFSFFAPRLPFKPIPIGAMSSPVPTALAATAQPSSAA